MNIKNNVLIVGFGSFGRESLVSLKKYGLKYTAILVEDNNAAKPLDHDVDIGIQLPPIPTPDYTQQLNDLDDPYFFDLDAPYWQQVMSKVDLSLLTHVFLIGDMQQNTVAHGMSAFAQAMRLSSVLTFSFYTTSYEHLDQNTAVNYVSAIEAVREYSHLSTNIILSADELKANKVNAVAGEARAYIENFSRSLLFNIENGFRRVTDNNINEEISMDFSDIISGNEMMNARFVNAKNQSLAVAVDEALSTVTERNPQSIVINIFGDSNNDDLANEVLTKVQTDLSPGEIWFGAHRTKPIDNNETEVSLLLYY